MRGPMATRNDCATIPYVRNFVATLGRASS
jgi:hypothetical protein